METWAVDRKTCARHGAVPYWFLPFEIRPATEKGQTRPSPSNYRSLALPLAPKINLQINFLQIDLAD